MYLYKAFGLTVRSPYPIAQLNTAQCDTPDVTIVPRDLGSLSRQERGGPTGDPICFRITDLATFRISGGNLIEVDVENPNDPARLGVFLMGSCMGAIIHQRGLMPMHGSCVTNGQQSILLTGDSGAGKSTLAAEFLKNGWKLITDDVSVLYDIEQRPLVQSSYPSQKLWQDALDRYERPEEDIHSLYERDNREKFGVDVARYFFDGRAPLSMVVRLLPIDGPCTLEPMEGMTKVDQLLRNTYRLKMLEMDKLQRHFQRCVTLSGKIPMALVTRTAGLDCAAQMYDLITDYLGGMNHD